MGFQLIAGEFPGGTDHELYPLNITDPSVARDASPDPRRHSAGEMIPDIVAKKGKFLVIGEAKVDYDLPDRSKLDILLTLRKNDLFLALAKFAIDHDVPELLPVSSLTMLPTLIFTDRRYAPPVSEETSYIVLSDTAEPQFAGPISKIVS